MPDEQEYHLPLSRHAEVFGLTEREDLLTSISDKRFKSLVNDPNCEVLEVCTSTNAFGEYLFVTLRKVIHHQPFCVTLYGLGFHEQREQWITTYWRWYQANIRQGIPLSKEKVLETIQRKRDEIAPYMGETSPSERAILFSLLAEFSDEDGVLSLLDDLDE